MVGRMARVKDSPDALLKKAEALGALEARGASWAEFSGMETKGTAKSAQVSVVSSTRVTGLCGVAETSAERSGKKVRSGRQLEKGTGELALSSQQERLDA